MTQVLYTVTAILPDDATVDAYADWLLDGHISDVLEASEASSALVVRLPGRMIRTQYFFPSQESLDRYIRERAPALRAEGLRLFGPDRGVQFQREVGQIVHEATATRRPEGAGGGQVGRPNR
ncbi:MAG: DUF4286 family protein [Planctomycetota bacterium]|nr:DUF4286 family protein [Planctomycetota bacterium]